MNQNLKDMLQSGDIEDIELALIMARKTRVNPNDVVKSFSEVGKILSPLVGNLIHNYIRSTHMGRKWKWRKEL